MSKLNEIEAALNELELALGYVFDDINDGIPGGLNVNQDRVHDAKLDIHNNAVDWLIALLPAVKAAQAMRAEIKNIPQTVMTYHMYDVVADYDKALKILEADSKTS